MKVTKYTFAGIVPRVRDRVTAANIPSLWAHLQRFYTASFNKEVCRVIGGERKLEFAIQSEITSRVAWRDNDSGGGSTIVR